MQGHLEELSYLDLSKAVLPPGVQADWAQSDGTRRWATGRRSTLAIPCPRVDSDLVLVLTVDPFCCVSLPRQLLRVSVDGTTLRLARFGERAIIACRVPQAMTAGRDRLDIRFEHPDVVRPDLVSKSQDSRVLSVGFVGLGVASWREGLRGALPPAPSPTTQLPPVDEMGDRELMLHFASLGDNCEFGAAQRAAQAEPLDLLRFASLPIEDLLSGLSCGFEDVDRLNDLEFIVYESRGRREYMLHQRRYALHSHTNVDEGQMSTVRLLGRERRKLDVLRRLLRADLIEGRRIFVYKARDDDGRHVVAILQGLRAWGPNTLLHVVHADGRHPPGHVEVVGNSLLRGYIDRFNPYDNAAAPPSPVWRELCRNAYAIWRRLGWRR